jgi:hypothetical protein
MTEPRIDRRVLDESLRPIPLEHGLQQVSAGSGLDGPLGFDISFERGQHQDAGFRNFTADCGDHIDAAHVG